MWFFSSGKSRRTTPKHSSRPTFRPRVQALEDRCLMSAGMLDPTFNPTGSPAGTATAAFSSNATGLNALVQPSGKIVVIGYTNGFSLAEFDANGSLDPNFGSGGTVTTTSGKGNIGLVMPNASVLYPTGSTGDQKILLAGWGTNATFILARYNADGSLDTSFGKGGVVGTLFTQNRGDGGEGVVLVPNGTGLPKIVMVGSSGNDTGVELARYNPDGSLDTSFGSKGTAYVALSGGMYAQRLAQDPVSGDFIVAGATALALGGPPEQGRLAAFTSRGTLDSSFGTGGLVTTSAFSEANGLAVYPTSDAHGNGGKIVVVANGVVARYSVNGTLDTTWGGAGMVTSPIDNFAPFGATIDSDGKVLASGNNSDHTQFAVARFNTDGSLDSSFGNGGVVTTLIGTSCGSHGVTVQANGDIVVAGSSNTASGTSVFAVARYLPSEPEIGSVTANQVMAGGPVTLTASNISDGNPNSTISQVTFFYYDSNGNQVVVGTVTAPDSSGNWTLSASLPPGNYTLYAQATDSYGVLGDPLAFSLTVQ